jgi:hypothetical protein
MNRHSFIPKFVQLLSYTLILGTGIMFLVSKDEKKFDEEEEQLYHNMTDFCTKFLSSNNILNN